MDNTTLFILWIGMLGLWALLYFTLKFKLNQPFTIVLFGLSIVLLRLNRWGYQTITRPRTIKLPTISKPVVNKVLDYISAYQLGNTEIITGMYGSRPIKIDIMEEHTMLGGSTGGSKTWLLHAWLIQLFGKGSRFTDNVKVYLVDFKGHPKDMWHEWLPLLTGYAKRSETGDISECLDLLKQIDQMLQLNVKERILVIIEEAYLLTANKEGDALLGSIASQLRLNGSLIVTIQHPQHSKIETFVKHNIARRVAGMVLNQSQAEVILEVRPPVSDLPNERGHYLLREPGKRSLIKFQALKPDLPAEIQEVVRIGIDLMTEKDERLKIFREVCQGKKKGAAITGAQTLGKEINWLKNAQFTLMVAYRNFVKAGAFIPPEGKGSRNHMACDFEEGFAKVKTFIAAGKWEKEADKII